MKVKRSGKEKIDDLVGEYILARQKIRDLESQIHEHFDREKIESFFHQEGIVTRGKNKKLTIGKS